MAFIFILPVILYLVTIAGLTWAVFAFPHRVVPRILLAVCLAPLILFCLFGFLATFEPIESARQFEFLMWRVGYALVGLGALGAVLLLVFRRKRIPADANR